MKTLSLISAAALSLAAASTFAASQNASEANQAIGNPSLPAARAQSPNQGPANPAPNAAQANQAIGNPSLTPVKPYQSNNTPPNRGSTGPVNTGVPNQTITTTPGGGTVVVGGGGGVVAVPYTNGQTSVGTTPVTPAPNNTAPNNQPVNNAPAGGAVGPAPVGNIAPQPVKAPENNDYIGRAVQSLMDARMNIEQVPGTMNGHKTNALRAIDTALAETRTALSSPDLRVSVNPPQEPATQPTPQASNR